MKFIIATIPLLLLPFASVLGQDDSKPNIYSINIDLSVTCIGGWEADCLDAPELYFTKVEKGTYNFSNSIGLNYTTGIKLKAYEIHKKPAKITMVRQRYIMAYASRVSETEGVIFCDTSLSILKGKKDNSWFSYTKFYPLISDTAGYYIINDQAPNSGMYKSPRIGTSTAKQHITKDHKWLFDIGTDQELRNNREVKVWPYAIELEFTTSYLGKKIVYKFRFRIRHGEC